MQPNTDEKTPPITPPKVTSPRLFKIIVRSVMEKNDLARILATSDATVRDLRRTCRKRIGPKAESQALLFEGKELKDEDKTLGHYGMIADCIVYLSPKMSTGSTSVRTPTNLVMIVSNYMPTTIQTTTELRNTLKRLTVTRKKRQPVIPIVNPKSQWTAEKQMEHELTRNRMKELQQRRKQLQKTSSQQNVPQNSSASDNSSKGAQSPIFVPIGDTGSICGSIGQSPLGSEPGTPREKLLTANSSTTVEPKSPLPVTAKELKLYYTAPETMHEAEVLRQDLYPPPQNLEELQNLRMELAELKKSTCNVCRRRLPILHQSLKCQCDGVFCSKHRNAEQHKCVVDYKQTGRKKLAKDVPKLELGGARKAKPDN